MSSTNRGGDRHAADYYITPQWAIRDFLNAAQKDVGQLYEMFQGKSILDPCAGGDSKNPQMAYPHAVKASSLFPSDSDIVTVDWREDSYADFKSDFLMWQPGIKFDLAITNPPLRHCSGSD